MVMPKNILDGKIDTSDIAFIQEDDAERLRQHRLSVGDIVYGRRGDIGRRGLVGARENGWLCGTGCLRVSLGNRVIDPVYLYYFLGQPTVVSWIANQAIGATMPNLNTTILRSVQIRYPRLPVQRRIASILSAYDELIDNNIRRIKILEEMAQMLYREWFVKFRFPGHERVKMVESELGPIPEDWRIEPLAEVYRIGSGGTPSRRVPSYFGGSIQWVKTQELRDGFVQDTDEKITEEGLKNSSAKLYARGTVLMAMYGATIGKLGILSAKQHAIRRVVR
jgi:type I restriction enzyme S subunit